MKRVKSAYDFEEGDYLLWECFLFNVSSSFLFLKVAIYKDDYNKVFLSGYKVFGKPNGKIEGISKHNITKDFIEFDNYIKYEMGKLKVKLYLLTKKEAQKMKEKIMLEML